MTARYTGSNDLGGVKRVNAVVCLEWCLAHGERSVSVSCYCYFIILPFAGLPARAVSFLLSRSCGNIIIGCVAS